MLVCIICCPPLSLLCVTAMDRLTRPILTTGCSWRVSSRSCQGSSQISTSTWEGTRSASAAGESGCGGEGEGCEGGEEERKGGRREVKPLLSVLAAGPPILPFGSGWQSTTSLDSTTSWSSTTLHGWCRSWQHSTRSVQCSFRDASRPELL